MSPRKSAVPPRKIHSDTVLRVTIERPAGKHVTQLVITTVGGEHRVRLLPRMVRQLTSRLNSIADKYDLQQLRPKDESEESNYSKTSSSQN
jgi:hypothetical protein